MQYRYLAIEGNIGVGKSTLAVKLAEHYSARLVLENFADNNFLPRFYQDQERYAFPLELSFLADRYKQLREELAAELFSPLIISDYIFIKSKLFARTTLEPGEYELFQRLFDIIEPQLPQPDLLIFLQAPVNVLQQRIRQRGRSYEQSIQDSYLEKVQSTYNEWLQHGSLPTLMVDTTNINFLEPTSFEQLIERLEGVPVTRREIFPVK